MSVIAIIAIAVIALLVFTRGFSWFGRLPGDFKYEGRSTRLYAPLVSMLLLSLALSLIVYLVSVLL